MGVGGWGAGINGGAINDVQGEKATTGVEWGLDEGGRGSEDGIAEM